MNRFYATKIYLRLLDDIFKFTVITCLFTFAVGVVSNDLLGNFSNERLRNEVFSNGWTFSIGICIFVFSIQTFIFWIHYLWLRFTKFCFPDFDIEGVLHDAYATKNN